MNRNIWHAWRFDAGRWESQNAISVMDRGFRYGMSVFETCSVRGRKILFLKEHANRLSDAIRALDWKFDGLAEALEFFSSTEEPEDGVIRIYLTAGEGGPIEAITSPGLHILWEALPFPDEDALACGWKLSSHHEKADMLFPGMKTGNYWRQIRVLQKARNAGADECLLFNALGQLSGAAMANVFLFTNGKWVTPNIASGARNGVIREWVMNNFDTVEKSIRHDAVSEVKEIIAVNSRIGIMPVREFDGVKMKMDQGRELAAAYLRKVIHA